MTGADPLETILLCAGVRLDLDGVKRDIREQVLAEAVDHHREGHAELLNGVYAERNAVVLAFARMALDRGWIVGHEVDDAEPDWPVLLIDTPEGQVTWHFKVEDMPDWVPTYPGTWDGHDTPEKYRRLAALTARPGEEIEEQSVASEVILAQAAEVARLRARTHELATQRDADVAAIGRELKDALKELAKALVDSEAAFIAYRTANPRGTP